VLRPSQRLFDQEGVHSGAGRRPAIRHHVQPRAKKTRGKPRCSVARAARHHRARPARRRLGEASTLRSDARLEVRSHVSRRRPDSSTWSCFASRGSTTQDSRETLDELVRCLAGADFIRPATDAASLDDRDLLTSGVASMRACVFMIRYGASCSCVGRRRNFGRRNGPERPITCE
jgi:hypothetical protein